MSSASGKGSLLTAVKEIKKNQGTWMLFIIFSYFAFECMLKISGKKSINWIATTLPCHYHRFSSISSHIS